MALSWNPLPLSSLCLPLPLSLSLHLSLFLSLRPARRGGEWPCPGAFSLSPLSPSLPHSLSLSFSHPRKRMTLPFGCAGQRGRTPSMIGSIILCNQQKTSSLRFRTRSPLAPAASASPQNSRPSANRTRSTHEGGAHLQVKLVLSEAKLCHLSCRDDEGGAPHTSLVTQPHPRDNPGANRWFL